MNHKSEPVDPEEYPTNITKQKHGSISFIQSKALVHKKMNKEWIHKKVRKDCNENETQNWNKDGENELEIIPK